MKKNYALIKNSKVVNSAWADESDTSNAFSEYDSYIEISSENMETIKELDLDNILFPKPGVYILPPDDQATQGD